MVIVLKGMFISGLWDVQGMNGQCMCLNWECVWWLRLWGGNIHAYARLETIEKAVGHTRGGSGATADALYRANVSRSLTWAVRHQFQGASSPLPTVPLYLKTVSFFSTKNSLCAWILVLFDFRYSHPLGKNQPPVSKTEVKMLRKGNWKGGRRLRLAALSWARMGGWTRISRWLV